MEQDLVSIIIPCYNASRYLNDVFLSVKNQTYQNLEVIFVDDGSTDDTGKMLDEFAKSYSKAKIIHKENGDVSSARNAGIKKAKGKYIYFMDSDDIIHPNTIFYSYNLIVKYLADVVCSNYQAMSNDKTYNSLEFKKRKSRLKIINGSDDVLFNLMININDRNPWRKLYKTDLLKKMPNYPNLFDVRYSYAEDALFLFQYYQYCNVAIWSNQKHYYYRKNKSGKVHSPFSEKDESIFEIESTLRRIDPQKYPNSITYIPAVICFTAMDSIRKLSYSDYHNSKIANEIYHRYRDNLKYLPRLSRLPCVYRFGTLFTLPVMYLMIRKKLKG